MSKQKLDHLASLAADQKKAMDRVEEKEAELKKAKEALREIAETQIPEVMDELGLEEFSTKDGLKITVKENIRASITKANLVEAIQWLRKNGHEKIITHEFTAIPADPEEAKKLRATLKGFHATEKPSVHPSRLSSFVRSKLEAGEEVPMDLLGVFRQRVAKIEVKK